MSKGTHTFEGRLSAVADEVEQRLEVILSRDTQEIAGEFAWPERLRAAMRHAVLGGGKRLRPFLVVETARLLGRDGLGPLLAGCALELVHCYSLVHDDLPAMDDDDLRRGRPTVHKAFDEATAILAGDALLTLAFEVMADGAIDARAQTRLDLTLALARAAGTAGMVGGQMHDLDAETLSARGLPPLGEAEIRRLQAMKTGALLAFAVDAGAMLGRTDAQTRRRLATYGQALGATFQIADDILDVEATAHELGKATGKDAARGKATLVAALGLERAKAERDRLAAVAVEALSGFGSEAEVMRDAARFMAKRRA